MAENWLQDQQDAFNTLTEDGFVFSFSRKIIGTFDPVTGKGADDTSVDFQAPGIIKRVSSTTNYENVFGVGTMIEQDDLILLIATKNYKPELQDETQIDGIDYQVKGISHLRPGVVSLIAYLLIKRR